MEKNENLMFYEDAVAAGLCVTEHSYGKIIENLKYEIECLREFNSKLEVEVLKNRRNKAGEKALKKIRDEFHQKLIVGRLDR